jgi:Zn-dependent metalloprotease
MDTWTIGEKVAGPALPGGALRFLYSPTLDGISKDLYAERYTGTGDNGGVHLNSGIPNLAFYLLSQGGGHPRSKTQTVVPGIGLDKAEQIFYLANTGKNRAGVALLPSSATFQVARFATAQAAENLYGRCSAEWQNVHMAWDAVGVAGAWSPCVKPPSGF